MARILVVDDEADIRYLVKQILALDDHETLEASNGQEGLEVVRSHPVDLAVVDVVMPVMDGLQMMKGLRCDYPEIPILAIAGNIIELLDRALDHGADRALPKPLYVPELLEVVQELLSGRSAGSR